MSDLASIAAGNLSVDNAEDDDGEIVMEDIESLEFDDDDAVVVALSSPASPAASPAPQSPSVHHARDQDGEFGSDYESDDFVGRSPAKKANTGDVRAGGRGGRKFGATTTR